ncbi:response regulator [Vibrio sp. TBV020]|uniref:response regulator n=1 Tax=Vibrio sp. TBV020 TaxID=3137398 RepID=UPI0038CD5001
MDRVRLARNISVRHKLFVLVALPILLLLVLVSWQVHLLSDQMQSLEKSKSFVLLLEKGGHFFRSSDDHLNLSEESQSLVELSSLVFGNDQQAKDLLHELTSVSSNAEPTTDVYEVLDEQEWQADIYKQLLVKLERVRFSDLKPQVLQHLSALLQLEWLMFWSSEETRITKGMINVWLEYQDYDNDLKEQIVSLVQNQQLYIERFVSLNADASQVSMMVEVFSNEVFSQSQSFRQTLASPSKLNAMSATELERGVSALSARLMLLQNVGEAIEHQLIGEVDRAIEHAEQQRIMFLAIVSLLTILVMVLAIKLAQRLTLNLKLVLDFLSHDDSASLPSLSKAVKGNDELSQFAVEVERLTIERQQAQERLTIAKEDAERAKDDAILASKAKSSFLANMSHEIRTPLNGVIGIAEVLADTELNANQKDYVDTIETSSHLLLSLINDILDFSKIESGMLLVSPHSTCVRESMYDIASIVAPKAKEQGIDLNVSISPDTPFRVLVDDHRLRQVLMNFMSNAVKFTSEGEVSLSLDSHYQSSDNVALTFAVQDSGIGIDEQQQKKIFEPFSQEDDSTTRQFGGTGLGLAISTQLVELMGSQIQLESVKGEGSCFYFTLELPIDIRSYPTKKEEQIESPIVLVCDDTLLSQSISEELKFYGATVLKTLANFAALQDSFKHGVKPILLVVETDLNQTSLTYERLSELQSSGHAVCIVRRFNTESHDFSDSITALVTLPLLGQRLLKAIQSCDKKICHSSDFSGSLHPLRRSKLLIVEDNKINQKIAGLHVGKAGFDFDLANNGQEALDMYASNQEYGLILMDCMMPVMDGFTATQAIRELERSSGRRRIPIIALTASVVDDDIQRCFDVGMDDYVAKPFKATVLREKIDSMIQAPQVRLNDNDVQTIETDQREEMPAEPVLETASKMERILLVEDNRVNQKVAALFLTKAGYQFDIADNGQIAVDKFQSAHDYDLILMDCMMPVKDGFAATREIRQIEVEQGRAKTPIIALTASVIDDDIQRCYDSGMDAYVAKPMKKEKLLHEIANVI